MSNEIKDLINAIDKGNSKDIDGAFGTVMSQKVGERLDQMRSDLAANLFANNPADGEVDAESVEEIVPETQAVEKAE